MARTEIERVVLMGVDLQRGKGGNNENSKRKNKMNREVGEKKRREK